MKHGKGPEARKRIVITGGAGFIGAHLCRRLLAEGHEVTCIDSFRTGRLSNLDPIATHPGFRIIQADVTRFETVGLDPADEIYHLACAASPPHYQADPIHTMMTCVVGTAAFLDYAARCGARFLLASTSEVYGDPEVHPQTESYRGAVNPTGPRACYDEGKRAAEALAYDHARAGGVGVRVARIFNTYGPLMRADDGRVVSNFIAQALAGRPLTLYGTGLQTRSFCYVSDMVEGLMRLMGHPEPVLAPVNLGNPEERTMRELAETVARLCNVPLRMAQHPLPKDDPHRRCPDISRARSLLGWAPRVGLEAGLAETIASHRQAEHRAAPQILATGTREACAVPSPG
ncbi:MAG: SDR family oxidoreductase [Alphaproteobacteria bacterium]|nr:SDR family oxidoreductase [Alphaproteobacteria bacterium]